jgi:biotin synthesis protein BioG
VRHYWLNRAGNDELILFFAGWGFDENPFKSLDFGSYDVLMFYDYSANGKWKVENGKLFDTEQFSTVHIIAWSMGVFIARDLKVNGRKIAVNGTTRPIDDEFGIPKKVFELTLKHAATGLQGKFYKNACDTNYERYLQNPVQRSIENRVAELENLYKLINTHPPTPSLRGEGAYDIALVGMHDKIIPTANQLAFWGDKAKVLDVGHFPFYNYSLNELIAAEI